VCGLGWTLCSHSVTRERSALGGGAGDGFRRIAATAMTKTAEIIVLPLIPFRLLLRSCAGTTNQARWSQPVRSTVATVSDRRLLRLKEQSCSSFLADR